jgi:hypothetical protein
MIVIFIMRRSIYKSLCDPLPKKSEVPEKCIQKQAVYIKTEWSSTPLTISTPAHGAFSFHKASLNPIANACSCLLMLYYEPMQDSD